MVERLMEEQAAKSTEKQYKIMQGPETMKVVMNHSESTTLEKTSHSMLVANAMMMTMYANRC